MSFGNQYNQQSGNPYASLAQNRVPAAQAAVSDRISFIRNTYLHLALAVFALVVIEFAIFSVVGTDRLIDLTSRFMSGFMWLVVMGVFMAVSHVANRLAHSQTSTGVQYAGLAFYVAAEALILVPLLAIAAKYFPGAIETAGIVTAVVFAGLTLTVFVTQADFSFLRVALTIGGFAAMGVIVAGIVLQLDIFGSFFAGAMVVLMAGYILYNTSNVLHHYGTTQHVAAALALFASVATLFWYILQLVMSMRD